jgi:hypothetical protein
MPIMAEKSLKTHCFKNVKYYTNKIAWMSTAIFMEFLRVLDVSIGVHDVIILLSVDNSATHLQDTSFLRDIKFVYCPPNCTGIMPSTRTGYGYMLRNVLTSVLTRL